MESTSLEKQANTTGRVIVPPFASPVTTPPIINMYFKRKKKKSILDIEDSYINKQNIMRAMLWIPFRNPFWVIHWNGMFRYWPILAYCFIYIYVCMYVCMYVLLIIKKKKPYELLRVLKVFSLLVERVLKL